MDEKEPSPQHSGWSRILCIAIVAGLLFAVLIPIPASSSVGVWLGRAAGTIMIAGASLLVGGLGGFLFGIPRTSGSDGGDEGSSIRERRLYQQNTNLEQISDWLTKILVGVGLTQVGDVPGYLEGLGRYLAPTLGDMVAGEAIVLSIVIYFVVGGFLFSYLWSRIYLGDAMEGAEVRREVRREVRSQVGRDVQQQIDKLEATNASALSMTKQYLDGSSESEQTDSEELQKAVREASPSAKVQIFYQAVSVRMKNWEHDKDRMARSIHIFQALCDADKEHRFHKNFGQLGFALKDQVTPQWAKAEEALSEAIRIRGDWRQAGWSVYEANRAICRAHLDKKLDGGEKAPTAVRSELLDDLRIMADSCRWHWIEKQDRLQKWIDLNLTPEEIQELKLRSETARQPTPRN